MIRGSVFRLALLLTVLVVPLAGTYGQCPTSVLTAGLKAPTKVIFSTKGNLVVAEQGEGPNTGRISLISPDSGVRRTLIDGLPSGLSAPNNDPAGPAGLAMRGRTLYVAIGVGDAVILGPLPTRSSPIPVHRHNCLALCWRSS